MDDGICADKDLPTMDEVEESIFNMLDSITISNLPFTIEVKHQESGELIERRTYSLELSVVKP